MVGCLLLLSLPLSAAPALLNHQGRMAVNGVNFEGTGQFKFALVNTAGTTTYWSNNGTSTAGSQPTAAVSLTVTKGLYAVILGDTALANMAAIPVTVFDNADVRLRVWFNDGTTGFQQITPDQRLVSAPYAFNATKADIAGNFTGPLAGDVTGTQAATAIAAPTVTGKLLTGYISGAGTITATDSLLGAINKLNGNVALRAPLASPTFTGTVTGTFSGSAAALTNLNGASLTAGTVGSAALAANSVDTSKIADGTIVNADISATAAIADTKLAAISTAGKVANSATTGTAANTPNTLVLRDAAGNFTAGTINGTFVGNGSGLTALPLGNLMAAPVKPVVAWGDNTDGQTAVPPLTGVAAVSAGSTHPLVLLNGGTVVTWGNGPAVPAGLTGVTRIAAGCGFNLVRKSDGTVVAWGLNTSGQTTVPAGITNATDVAAGEKHSLALRATGTITAWGDNTFGQTTVPAAATSVTAIACGYDHSLALKADGTVVAWGRNDAGQTTIPAGLTGVVAIGAGSYHSLAVRNNGTVVAWGWDQGYQSTVPAGLTGVTKVAGGYAFSMALKTDGTIVAWGDNSRGQTEPSAEATQVTAIAASASFALALRSALIPAQVARLDQENVFTENVGIGRTPATNALEVEGNASKSTAGSWLSNSDRRIKTEIQPVTGALEKLDQVRLVDFRYTDAYRAAHPGIQDKRYLNVIAQEFAKVFPDDVKSSGENMPDGSPILQVDTYGLTIYSAAAVQELHREKQALKATLDEQKKALAAQEERLRKLEAALNLK